MLWLRGNEELYKIGTFQGDSVRPVWFCLHHRRLRITKFSQQSVRRSRLRLGYGGEEMVMYIMNGLELSVKNKSQFLDLLKATKSFRIFINTSMQLNTTARRIPMTFEVLCSLHGQATLNRWSQFS